MELDHLDAFCRFCNICFGNFRLKLHLKASLCTVAEKGNSVRAGSCWEGDTMTESARQYVLENVLSSQALPFD